MPLRLANPAATEGPSSEGPSPLVPVPMAMLTFLLAPVSLRRHEPMGLPALLRVQRGLRCHLRTMRSAARLHASRRTAGASEGLVADRAPQEQHARRIAAPIRLGRRGCRL